MARPVSDTLCPSVRGSLLSLLVLPGRRRLRPASSCVHGCFAHVRTSQRTGNSRFQARKARRSPWLAQAYVMTGRRAEAATLAAEHADSPSNLATIYASLGDKDRAFEALERVAVVQPHHVGKILINPEMTVLRGDPRLAPFRKRFNLP